MQGQVLKVSYFTIILIFSLQETEGDVCYSLPENGIYFEQSGLTVFFKVTVTSFKNLCIVLFAKQRKEMLAV